MIIFGTYLEIQYMTYKSNFVQYIVKILNNSSIMKLYLVNFILINRILYYSITKLG